MVERSRNIPQARKKPPPPPPPPPPSLTMGKISNRAMQPRRWKAQNNAKIRTSFGFADSIEWSNMTWLSRLGRQIWTGGSNVSLRPVCVFGFGKVINLADSIRPRIWSGGSIYFKSSEDHTGNWHMSQLFMLEATGGLMLIHPILTDVFFTDHNNPDHCRSLLRYRTSIYLSSQNWTFNLLFPISYF